MNIPFVSVLCMEFVFILLFDFTQQQHIESQSSCDEVEMAGMAPPCSIAGKPSMEPTAQMILDGLREFNVSADVISMVQSQINNAMPSQTDNGGTADIVEAGNEGGMTVMRCTPEVGVNDDALALDTDLFDEVLDQMDDEILNQYNL